MFLPLPHCSQSPALNPAQVSAFEVSPPIARRREPGGRDTAPIARSTARWAREDPASGQTTTSSPAGDGKPLKIGGHTFAKGQGVHPDSEIVYKLDGKYEFFATFLGTDDEVGNRGSAQFQVWLDGVKAWESAKLDGDDQPRSLVLNV